MGIETAFARMTANRAAISGSRASIFFLCLLRLASLGMKKVEGYLDCIDGQNRGSEGGAPTCITRLVTCRKTRVEAGS